MLQSVRTTGTWGACHQIASACPDRAGRHKRNGHGIAFLTSSVTELVEWGKWGERRGMGRANGASGTGPLKFATTAVAAPPKHSRLQTSIVMQHECKRQPQKLVQSVSVYRCACAESRTVGPCLDANAAPEVVRELADVVRASRHSTQRLKTSNHATSKVYYMRRAQAFELLGRRRR